ncbi:L-aspartate oxidase [Psychrobacter sp. PL15]|uniref:L-aspartate oxidase n=1 Tax=Psychrobacter sp. PL15 TaxID=3071719 RepID=UPI002E03461F|nr:L-aspartate oxidase [Psychrobacter sp. PL15]
MNTVLTADKMGLDKPGLHDTSVNQHNANEPSIDDSSVNGKDTHDFDGRFNSELANNPFHIHDNNSNDAIHTDVLIIGAGLAGLSTALALPKSLSITLLSKAALETCSSHYAQGGIAASLDKNDQVADHVADTLIAGAGLCATDNTTTILSAGQQAVQWLCAQGVPFTQIPQQSPQDLIANAIPTTDALAELKTADLHLTQEGGHGCRRVAHADDATGRHIMQTLSAQAQVASNITILPYHEALELLTEPLTEPFTKEVIESVTKPFTERLSNTVTNQSETSSQSQHSHDRHPSQHAKGALVFDHNTQRRRTFYSRAIVLASGGLGQLFQRASAPNVCVGDGVMMAWQAGCRLANLEFIQFHPTGLALGNSSFLVSEALRGEGGRLYCPQTGQRFMLDVDSRAELAPRDIVARAISEQITGNGLGYVHLDVSHLPAEFLQQHFPQIYQTLLDLGIDITTDPIPVAPTAHYSCGGVVTCADGLTDVPGLYAAGEVAYTGLHGANRLASNSLLECVVVGRNIAAHLPGYLAATPELPVDIKFNAKYNTKFNAKFNAKSNAKSNAKPTSQFDTAPDTAPDTELDAESVALAATIWTSPKILGTQSITLPSAVMSAHTDYTPSIDPSADVSTNVSTDDITAELKALMSNNMGIMRNAEKLEQAMIQIQHWQQTIKESDSISESLTSKSGALKDLATEHSSTDDLNGANSANSSATLKKLANFQLTRQLQLATLIIQSAYQRCESRGGHYRQDYPQLASTPLVSIIEPFTSNTDSVDAIDSIDVIDTIEEPIAWLPQALVSSHNRAKQLQTAVAV